MIKPRRRKGKPYDPSKAHDRRSNDLLRNAQVTPVEVQDPYDASATIIVMRSTRADPLADMNSRGQIDDAQYHGGRAFQQDFEMAERGPRAIDPFKECVDGGVLPEPITEQQRRAVLRLNGAERSLGQDGSGLMHDLLISQYSIEQIAAARGFRGRKWSDYFRDQARIKLDQLAFFYGFSNAPPEQ